MAEKTIPTKDAIRDAINFSGASLDGRNYVGQSTPIKVYFMPVVKETDPAFKPYTDQQIAQANEADRPGMTNLNATYRGIRLEDRQNLLDNVFGVWSKMANISFEATTNLAEAQIRVGGGMWSDNASVNLPGWAPGARLNSVFIRTDFYNPSPTDSTPQFQEGTRQTHDMIHEVGHAIGLNHPTVDQSGGILPATFNRMWFNVMTNNGPNTAGWGPTSPSLFDAVGLQALYGLRSLDETDNYKIEPGTGRLIIDNGSGADTLDASGTTTDNDIDLRAADFSAGKAYFSSIGLSPSFEQRYNVAIYEGTVIENAVGGRAKDTITGNDAANRIDGGDGDGSTDILQGGKGEDTYVFKNAFGKDVISDSDGLGKIEINGTAATAVASRVTVPGALAWEAKIGNQTYRYTLRKPVQAGNGEQLEIAKVLSKGVKDTANTITINNFDQDKAANGGYLGIRIDRKQALILIEPGAENGLADSGFDPATLDGKASTIAEGLGKSFMIYLAGPAKAGDTITLALTGAGDKFKAITGNTTVAANGAVITLTEGQTVVSFALVQEGAVTADASASLSVSYQGEYGSASSNSWAVALKDAGETTSTVTGDQHGAITVDSEGQQTYTGPVMEQEADYDDVLYASSGNAKLDGKGGNDVLGGGAGNDLIEGGEGNDLIAGGTGSDTINGGAGDDRIHSSSSAYVPTRLYPGEQWMQGAWVDRHGQPAGVPEGSAILQSYTSWGVFRKPGEQSSLIWGVTLDLAQGQGDVVDAGAGNDRVYGSNAGDRLQGGADNDVLYGLGGNDIVEGGEGGDQLSGDGDLVPERNGEGYYSFEYAALAEQGNDFLDGGAGTDTLYGRGGADVLYGGADGDTLYGDDVDASVEGADYLNGEGGNDRLYGGGKDDVLYGGADDDWLYGDDEGAPVAQTGQDYLDGGDGSDRLVGRADISNSVNDFTLIAFATSFMTISASCTCPMGRFDARGESALPCSMRRVGRRGLRKWVDAARAIPAVHSAVS